MNPRAPQPHHESHHSPVGHWTRTLGALAPLVITELVEDRTKQLRFIRIASVALAVLSEASYAYRVQQERRKRELQR